MSIPPKACEDGEEFNFQDGGQDWIISWHSPNVAPPGTPHGSAAVCFTPERKVVLVSATHGKFWEFPGGRPEGNEEWRDTLEREVSEEACAQVTDASLLGFCVGRCTKGHEEGLVIVRAAWRSAVVLMPWKPQHETTDRRTIEADTALDAIRIPQGARPIYERWMQASLA